MNSRTRSDCTVETLLRKMEREKGLPKGSVKVVNPNGRSARADKTVGSLRRDYGGLE